MDVPFSGLFCRVAMTQDSAVSDLIRRAREAQKIYEDFDQAQVDDVVAAIAWVVLEPDRNRYLSKRAVEDTGLGDVEDKFIKNYRKTLGLLRDLSDAKSVGVISEDPVRGIIEIARPVGVVGAITPSTNPVATPTNKVMNALKGRNAIILAPSPRGEAVCEELVAFFQDALERVGAPRDLVQKLPKPVNKADTETLMKSVDLIVATGSQNNIRSAYSSGTPAVGVGAGNVSVIVDETADCDEAVRSIVASKTFDNATSCSSENCLVVVEANYQRMLGGLSAHGAILLNAEEKTALQALMWINGKLNPRVIAKSAAEVAAMAGIAREDGKDIKVLLVEETGAGPDFPFSGEKLSPVLALYRAADFSAAMDTVRAIYAYQGAGHSVGIHTRTGDRPVQIGLSLPTCRVIVNQAHCFATGGSFDNALPFSLSMGCGSWGGNSISENMNFRHYLNTVRVVARISPQEVSPEDLLSDYWSRYGK
ncbi:MAG: aldehyde dehydrogenase family protein [Gammaproteobacteria bacterium]